jgi:ribosome biogenesis protein Nip4
MRPLTEEETKTLFLKLAEYIGKNIEYLINRDDERHCFRLLKDRVYYVRESLVKAATSIQRDNLLHLGVRYLCCFVALIPFYGCWCPLESGRVDFLVSTRALD